MVYMMNYVCTSLIGKCETMLRGKKCLLRLYAQLKSKACFNLD